MHFRGVRRFTWAGYKVKITVPGKDHPMLEEVDIGMKDAYWADDNRARFPRVRPVVSCGR
jgi:hypothetical protein